MALASPLRIRHGGIRLCSRSVISGSSIPCRPHVRLFSSMLQNSPSSHRFVAPRMVPGSRNLWGWSSSTPSNSHSEVPQPMQEPIIGEPVEAVTSAVDASTLPVTANAVDVVSTADIASSSLSDIIASHVPAALQYGDLAALGIAGWTPAGIVRWSMELIHIGTGMPWFWTIIAGTALWRLVCLPFVLQGVRTSARLLPVQGQLTAVQQRISDARLTHNVIEMQKASLAMKEIYSSNNINPFSGLVSLVQLPVTLGVFFGVQKMCTLPVEQLKHSGFSFIPDLTAIDPTYVLPAIMIAAVNLQIHVGARELDTQNRPDMAHFMNVFKLLTIPGVFFMAQFPSGLLVSLLTTACLTITQSLVLRVGPVRRLLGIPIPPASAQGKLPPMLSTLRRVKAYFYDDVKAKVEQAQKLEAQHKRMDHMKRPRSRR